MDLEKCYTLNPLTSVFRYSSGIYLFAPQTRTFSSLNEPMLELLLKCDGRTPLGAVLQGQAPGLHDIFAQLYLLEVLVPADVDLSGAGYLGMSGKKTMRLTIFPTTACNLECIYCYASGGDTARRIPENMRDLAIEYFFSALPDSHPGADGKEEPVHLSIHGGGEPTVDMDLLRGIVAAFSAAAERADRQVKVSLVSNGTFSREARDWLLENKIGVSISLDGPPDVQNRQRPYRSGRPTFDDVAENVRALVEAGREVAIRATVTQDSLDSMQATVEMAAELGIVAVHFEPVSQTGRGLQRGIRMPEAAAFSANFLQCFVLGLEKDIEVSYSGMRCFDHFHNHFCSACGDNLCVTPDGYLTTCYEVLTPDDPAAETFFIGRVDVEQNRVVVDEQKVAALKERVTENLRSCSSCFLRYNCAGDCLARTFRSSGNLYAPDRYRCQVAEAVNKQLIAWLADGVIEPRASGKVMVTRFNR